MSYAAIPVYRLTAFGEDLRRCPAWFKGVKRHEMPDEYEIKGYLSGHDGTPYHLEHPEWKPNGQTVWKYSSYLRARMRESRRLKCEEAAKRRAERAEASASLAEEADGCART